MVGDDTTGTDHDRDVAQVRSAHGESGSRLARPVDPSLTAAVPGQGVGDAARSKQLLAAQLIGAGRYPGRVGGAAPALLSPGSRGGACPPGEPDAVRIDGTGRSR